MSKANRKKVYEKTKNNKTNHICDDVLRREFEQEKVTEESEAEREAKEKREAERKLKEDDEATATGLEEVKTLGV